MKAIGKNIVIEKIEEEITTESGILLSNDDTNSFRYQKGRVVMPGTEVSYLKADDIIYYDVRNSYTLAIDKVMATIIQERDVVVVE
jgi:co-chaperonin GroES (HSP10)